ncbi:MAG: hypothetical protein C5B60_04295 [Chloroflexi bacterium]|nr:MAG: hypothetical protein C5B60_04295 [Chloroflexota bacterium]
MSELQVAGVPTTAGIESSSNSELLASYAALVTEIAGLLALTPERLARAEALDRLEITTQVTVERVLSWNTGRVARWFTQLGDDLQIDLSLAGLDIESTIPQSGLRAGRDPKTTMARFAKDAKSFQESHGDEVDVDVRLSIGKTRAATAARAWLSNRPEYPGSAELLSGTSIFVFYQASAVEKLLSLGALPEWEQRGLAHLGGRTIMVLCDASGYLAGMTLEILGASRAMQPRWLVFSRAAWREFQERASRVRALHQEESSWPTAPAVLTPAHLRLAEYAPGLESMAHRLRETQAALAACYLAGSVTGDANRELWLRFAGPRPATCHLVTQNTSTRGEEPSTIGPYTGGLAKLAAWAYHHASADKLAIARECLAHEIPPGTQVTLSGLEEAAVGALEAAKANLTLYLRHNTAQYFQLRQQALDLVTSYAASVRKAVSDLTSEVVENVYRTIGLLIGVIIAALIQPKLALQVQQVAASIYILYLVFLICYLLDSKRRRFELESSDLQIHLGAMLELSERERALLQSEAGGADQYFWQYFRWSRFIYVALAVASCLYLLLLFTPLAAHLPLVSPVR